MKKHLKKLSNHSFLVPLLLVAVIVQTIYIAQISSKADASWLSLSGTNEFPLKEPKNGEEISMTGVGSLEVKTLIAKAVEGIYTLSPVADIKTNAVYIPEVKIALPLSKDSRNIRYNFYEADKQTGTPTEVQINTVNNIGKPLTKWSQVPCLQRIVGFSVDKKEFTSGGEFGGSTKLADGRMLYFWLNDNKSCPAFWGESTQNDLLDLLTKAKSY